MITLSQPPWYADFANYLVCTLKVEEINFYQRKRFFFDVKNIPLGRTIFFHECADHIIRRCVP